MFDESLNEGTINEEYENGVIIPKKYLLANDYTEEEINELPGILWDKYTVNVKLTPKHIIITDDHHGYNVSYFMHYSDLSRFASDRKLRNSSKDESLTEGNVDKLVKHYGPMFDKKEEELKEEKDYLVVPGDLDVLK